MRTALPRLRTLVLLSPALFVACAGRSTGELPPESAARASGASTSVAPTPSGRAAWTLLVYMAADDDLEQAALLNIQEMAEVGSNAKVNVIVQIDRAPAEKNGAGYTRTPLLNLHDFHTTKRLRVERGSVVELADLGETCTCDPAPLASFISWALTTYPAEKTALVLWDHGGASHGFGWDVTSENRALSIADLGRGVANGLAGAGWSRFDVIGFDACLMSNLGVAYELRRSTGIFIGSEDLEPQSGWSYGPVVSAMAADATPKDLATEVIRSFVEECRLSNAVDLCTLAATDTSKIDAVVDALDDLGERLRQKSRYLADWYPIARARTMAEQVGAGAGDQSPYATVDAEDFATSVSRLVDEPNHVASAVDAAVIGSFHGLGKPAAHGLSLTFPRQAKDRVAGDDLLALTTRPQAKWDTFLRAYVDRVSADRTPPTVTGLGIVATRDGIDASGDLPDKDLADVSGVVGIMGATGELTLLSLTESSVAGTKAAFHWPRSLPALGDGHTTLPVTVFEEPPYTGADGKRVHIASLGGVLYLHGVLASAIDVVVYLKARESLPLALVGVYRREGGGPGSEVAIHPDDTLAPTVVTIAVDGRTTHAPSKKTLALGDKLQLVAQPAPAGQYAVGFRLTDYAANRRWEIMQVTVNPELH